MIELSADCREAHEAFLDLFAAVTGLPVAAYEFADGQVACPRSKNALTELDRYCEFVRRFPEGRARCEAGFCYQAADIQNTPLAEELAPCHAGLYVQVVPVQVRSELRSVLIYGRMLVAESQYLDESTRRCRQLADDLHLSKRQVSTLTLLMQRTRRYNLQRLEALATVLVRVERWFYALRDRDDLVTQSIEDVAHELQTRLQAVIASAANLTAEVGTLPEEELRVMAGETLFAALAMDAVVQNLGEYLGSYRFRWQSLASLVHDAVRLHRPEAERRGIDFRIHLDGSNGRPPVLAFSKSHLQIALSNLVHNAIKYSFRSGPGRQRYVRIAGHLDGDYYALVIENYGVGILAEEIERRLVFQPGYQGRLTRGEYRRGAGRGLYYAEQIIDRHGGRIEVVSESVAGEGAAEGQPHLTSFTVYLPHTEKGKEAHGDDRVDRG